MFCRPRQLDDDAPWFVRKPPEEITVQEGEPLTLQCIVDGDPKPAGKRMFFYKT